MPSRWDALASVDDDNKSQRRWTGTSSQQTNRTDQRHNRSLTSTRSSFDQTRRCPRNGVKEEPSPAPNVRRRPGGDSPREWRRGGEPCTSFSRAKSAVPPNHLPRSSARPRQYRGEKDCDHPPTCATPFSENGKRVDGSIRALRRKLHEYLRGIPSFTRHGEVVGAAFADTGSKDVELIELFRCSLTEFTSFLFLVDEEIDRKHTNRVDDSIEPNVRGEAIALLFECVNALARQEPGTGAAAPMIDCALVQACDFASRIFSQAKHDSGKPVVKMTNSQVSTCSRAMLSKCHSQLSMLNGLCTNDQSIETAGSGAGGLPLIFDICSKINPIMRCFSLFCSLFGNQMAAEETATDAVRVILLPVLGIDGSSAVGSTKEGDGTYSSDQPTSEQVSIEDMICEVRLCKIAAMDCIKNLVGHRQQASAIFAPLVVDVASGGEEQHKPNPLRQKTLGALEALVLGEDGHCSLSAACQALSAALNAVKTIERNNQMGGRVVAKSKASHPDIDTASIAKRVHSLLLCHPDAINIDLPPCKEMERLVGDRQTIRWNALHLLASLAGAYPSAAASHWNLFLPDSYVYCNVNKSNSAHLLLDIIQANASSLQPSDQERAAAVSATTAMLEAMPLRLWFGSTKQLPSGSPSLHLGTRHFGSRVSRSLEHLINGLCCTIGLNDGRNDLVEAELYSLAGRIMAVVPFDANDKLVTPAVELLTVIGNYFALAIKRGRRLEPAVSTAVRKAITESIGGLVTQQATQSVMPKPAREWLSSSASSDFIDQLCKAALTNDDEFRINVLSILCSLFRMGPWVAATGDDRLELVQNVIHELLCNQDENVRVYGVKLVESILLGRRDFSSDPLVQRSSYSFISTDICPQLMSKLSDPNVSIRTHALGAYGALQGSDWEILLERKSARSNLNLDLFCAVLGLCAKPGAGALRGEQNGSVRGAACRAMGNICTQIVTFSGIKEAEGRSVGFACLPDLDAQTVCQAVTNVLLRSKDDPNATARSMALFAVGNLALAIKSRQSEQFMIAPSSLIELCEMVHVCLDDVNEKVVGNAIRTIGHLAHLILYAPYERDLNVTCWNSSFCETLVRELTRKIGVAIDDATGTSPKMSWKQRSNAKKHGWGACNSLAFIFGSYEAMEKMNPSTTDNSIRHLIKCVEYAACLNEKITMAAVATLKAIPREHWRSLPHDCALIGVGLATCLILIFESEKQSIVSSNIVGEVGSLLYGLLGVASADDISQGLRNEGVTTSTFDFLYVWLTDRAGDSGVFNTVASGLQESCIQNKFEVFVVQKFQSRAMQELRRDTHGDMAAPSTPCQLAPRDVEVDEDDEL